MPTISRTGITGGGTIQPSHVTNIIDALDGTSTTTTVVASGSFSGSLTGGPVTVSTISTTGAANIGGAVTTTGINIDNGTNYGIALTVDNMQFNSANEDFNTVIRHYGGVISSSFNQNGISTTSRIVATSFTGSLQGTASFASQALSSSFATTASYALNAGGGTGFPFTGSAQITGSMDITGSLNVTGGVTASLFGTSSQAITASFATTASYALQAVSASFATTASYAETALSSSFATTASYVSSVIVTNNTTGTGPYSIPFVDVSTFNPIIPFTLSRGALVDASGLTYNATTNTITATASYALTALSSSFATTASYALNAGGGTGTGFPFTGSAQITGSMGITGSLNVTGGVTASLFGTSSRAITASFADLSRQVLVQRTAADADHFMVIVDSGNATPTAENLNTVTNIRVNPGTDTISAVNVSGSFNVTGSMGATKFTTVDFGIIGDASGTGQFVIPRAQTGAQPKAGSMYWNDSTGTLYIYSFANSNWYNVQLNP